MIKRRKTKTVKIGSVKMGGRYPVSIQSMTKTDTASGAIRQINALEKAGCEIVRVAVKDMSALSALKKIRAKTNIPLVADIHFNYRLGLEAIACGVDCLRLNPGNIYRREEVRRIAQAAGKRRIPIRVGVNSGSLRTTNYELRTIKIETLMVKAALDYIKMLESFDFYDIIVSMKASDVSATINAYRKMSRLSSYPFHLGVTATGSGREGLIKSAIGIGSLLLEGIGDTVRVSLTGSPQEEVKAAKEILQALGLRRFDPEIIACPTCGRCQVDLLRIVKDVNDKLNTIKAEVRPAKVAIMGCEVNGPGEARDADIGVACGKRSAVLFERGKVIRRIKESQIVDTVIREITSKEREDALV
ncbi:MAG: flavodoxin-dependent (E)-4-hydroxy-3-methylbut-2-enyl-diphosphate synthase [Candidatus Omnitrophota bacterium]|nr:MAG: flavodoxin-dependent (E)-4-hydroxy-3-methylbut-2-enyl-diphosphate synthase [Candidatus Omnitrophota bacterium]